MQLAEPAIQGNNHFGWNRVLDVLNNRVAIAVDQFIEVAMQRLHINAIAAQDSKDVGAWLGAIPCSAPQLHA